MVVLVSDGRVYLRMLDNNGVGGEIESI